MTFIQQFLNLETSPNWKLMPGTKANSGQTGADGTGTFTPGTPATLTCKPSAGYYDAGFYQHFPFTFGKDHVVCYHAEYYLTAVGIVAAHELEMDLGGWTGTHRHHAGGQFKTTFRYFDPAASPRWVDTKIPVTITPNQFFACEIWCKFDIVNHTTEYLCVKANGVWLPITPGLTATADPATSGSSFLSPILQLDSDKAGDGFSVQAENVHIIVRS